MVQRTILTTGVNSGLGLAIALEVAKKGYRSIGSVRTEAKAEVVRHAAAKAGVEVETVLLDVNDAGQAAEVVAGLPPLYGLVNNAGFSVTGAIEDVGDDEARQILETMVVAPMRMARLVLPSMRAAKDGRIITISSIYGRTTTPFTGWYQAAKHAVEATSDALRMEVAGFGVKVVLVEPGGFRTAIFDEVAQDLARRTGSAYASGYERLLQANRLMQPLLGQPGQVARLVVRIIGSANPRARYLVGVDAQALAVTERVTPTFVKDLVTRKILGL